MKKIITILCFLLILPVSIFASSQYTHSSYKSTGKTMSGAVINTYIKPDSTQYDRLSLECDPQMLCDSMIVAFAKIGVQADTNLKSKPALKGVVKGIYTQESQSGAGGGNYFAMGLSTSMSGFTYMGITIYQGETIIGRVSAESRPMYKLYADKTADTLVKNLIWWHE